MNAIIARPGVGATPPASSPMGRKAKPQSAAGGHAAPAPADDSAGQGIPCQQQTAVQPVDQGAADWRSPVRAVLDQIIGLMQIVDEPKRFLWRPSDVPCELITHATSSLVLLADKGDAEPAWQDQTYLLEEVLWALESLRAAVELGYARGWPDRTPREYHELQAAASALSAFCEALEEWEEEPRTRLLMAAADFVSGAANPPITSGETAGRASIRRAPTALDMEMLAGEAERIGLLVEWCIKAHATIEQICMEANAFPAFHAVLRERRIAFSNADWASSRMDECLADVLQRQSHLIKQMAGHAS